MISIGMLVLVVFAYFAWQREWPVASGFLLAVAVAMTSTGEDAINQGQALSRNLGQTAEILVDTVLK